MTEDNEKKVNEREIVDELRREEEILQRDWKVFEEKELQIMKEILVREKKIEAEEEKIEQREEQIDEREAQIEQLLEEMKTKIEGAHVFNFEEWMKTIWSHCDFKEKTPVKGGIHFTCSKIKNDCTYNKCPLNKK